MRPFDILDIDIFGESHSPEIGATVTGLPSGETFDTAEVAALAARRKSGKYLFSTPRREDDEAMWEGCTDLGDGRMRIDGALTVRIRNGNIRPSDYSYARTPRPSHADYCAWVKDGAAAAQSGGGRFSGRMTAPLVAMGGVAEALLKRRGIRVAAYIGELGGVKGRGYADGELTYEDIAACWERPLPMLSNAEEAAAAVKAAQEMGDSSGGVVECVAFGVPAGLGDALFGGLESKLSAAVYAIPAVKGVEFGAGFDIARMRGSEANDPFAVRDGKVITLTNRSGGINGGISNGMPVVFRTAVKPTPSIYKTQDTVDYIAKKDAELSIQGRHDPCIVPRAAIVQTCAAALAVGDLLTARYGMAWMEDPTGYRKEVL